MTANTQPAASKKKSPLDVLEDILEDSKKGAQTPTPIPGAGKSPAQPTKLTPEQEEEQLADIRKQQVQQVEADQVDIQQKLQEIAGLKDSPQVKAAQQQEQAENQEKTDHEDFMQGHEIVQLQHKKVEINE